MVLHLRYVIVCLIKGEALKFHEKLVENVCFKFKVNRQRLPAHFTLKAPFETENIEDMENLIENFCKERQKAPISLDGIGNFRNEVIYMALSHTDEALKIHDDLIDELHTLKWLSWRKNDGKGRTFHCTIVTHLNKDKFNDIWEYVLKFHPHFSIYFDNISILQWKKDKWITYREFNLK